MVAFAVHALLETLCPVEQMISGLCVAPWFRYAETAVFCGGAGLAAALIVLFCTLAAPAHRAIVAPIAFLASGIAALVMALPHGSYAELVTALTTGALTTWWLRTRAARLPAQRASDTL